MGYTHYWYQPQVIDQAIFDAIRADFERLILPLCDAGVELAGGLGKGPPEINDHIIRFNGLNECGHLNNDEIVIPYPSEFAAGIGPSTTAVDEDSNAFITFLKHRCCNGRCSFETFSLSRWAHTKSDRDGLYMDFVKTAFRPYDVAVTAALIIAKRHLQDRFVVHSDGGDPQWVDAKQICQRVLGYGDWFGIVEMVEEWQGNPPVKQQTAVPTLVELNPGTLI